MGAPVVEVSHLSKRFRVRHEQRPSIKRLVTRVLRPFPAEDLWALQDVSFSLQHGEALGIIGHNGSGKSTLLKLIAGIIRPTHGAISVQGKIGGLFELTAGFHPELTGRDNVYLSASLMGLPARAVRKRFDAIAEFSELGHFLDVPVKMYSSGMAMRLGFAVAISFEPQVMLVDEVITVGDEHFQHKAYRHLQRIREQGCAIVLVSHGLPVIRQTCPRVIWLDHGRPQADGDADAVIEKYLAWVQEQDAR